MHTVQHRAENGKMGRAEILALVEDGLKSVEASIRLNYQSNVAMIPLVSDYLTNGGGKRLRPMLVLLSSRLCGYEKGDKDIVHSTVVEYIHAATLLHDDVVDDSDQRRGLPSANAKFGNPMSVLVGDYLFAKSFSLMASASTPEIIRHVSDATRHLAEGEVLQLVYNGRLDITEEQYFDVIFRKTAALITACCQVGACLGNATARQKAALEAFGKNIGIAFQMVDDL
ncbi:MAG: polyprenyl synthetase family protein, partial [Nitrospinae bacterium]|nr:polyprenyl synthetase family protein [Nitrospinota bacterium]